MTLHTFYLIVYSDRFSAPLGVESGQISMSQLQVSHSQTGYSRVKLRPHSIRATGEEQIWMASTPAWAAVDLGLDHTVSQIMILRDQRSSDFVKSIYIYPSDDGVHWESRLSTVSRHACY